MPPLTAPLMTPIAEAQGLVTTDPWQKYFTNLYREGFWKPFLGGATTTGGQAYGYQTGRFIKMGRFVTATANVGLTAKGTVSGYLIVGGLPFKAENQPGGMPTWSAAVSYFSLTGNFTWIGGHIYPGRSDVLLTGEATTGGAIAQLLDVSVLSDSSAVFLTVSYLAVE